MKTNIIFVQWSNCIGGLENITKHYENFFYYRKPTVLYFQKCKNGIVYKNQIYLNKDNKLLFFIKYVEFVIKNRYSIFHFQISNTYLILLAYFLGAKKIICQFHGCYSTKNDLEKIIWRFLQKRIKIIANSYFVVNEIKRKYTITKNVSTIPNFINLQKFIFSKKIYDKKEFIIIYAGRFAKGKNLSLIIDIANYISDPNIVFELYGDGPEKKNLESKIKEHSLEKKFFLYPFTTAIEKKFKNSHLFLFTSLYETFGNVVAEAILSGLPVLCYKIPSLSEFIYDDFFFFDKLDPKLIAQKIEYMKQNYTDVTKRLLKLSDQVRKILDPINTIDKIEKIYSKFDNTNKNR